MGQKNIRPLHQYIPIYYIGDDIYPLNWEAIADIVDVTIPPELTLEEASDYLSGYTERNIDRPDEVVRAFFREIGAPYEDINVDEVLEDAGARIIIRETESLVQSRGGFEDMKDRAIGLKNTLVREVYHGDPDKATVALAVALEEWLRDYDDEVHPELQKARADSSKVLRQKLEEMWDDLANAHPDKAQGTDMDIPTPEQVMQTEQDRYTDAMHKVLLQKLSSEGTTYVGHIDEIETYLHKYRSEWENKGWEVAVRVREGFHIDPPATLFLDPK